MLIKCPECGRDVSDTIDQCIHCGYYLKRKTTTPVAEKVEVKQTGVKDLCLRGGPSGVIVFLIINFLGGLVSLAAAIVFLVISLKNKDLFGLFALTIIFGIIALLFLPAAIRDIVRAIKNSMNKNPCIKYDYDNDRVIIYTLSNKEIIMPIEKFSNIVRGFWSSSNLMYFVCFDDKDRMRYINLGYPLTNAKAVKRQLTILRTRKINKDSEEE